MSVERIVRKDIAPTKASSEKEALRDSVEELIITVRTLTQVFERARDEVRAEPTSEIVDKFDQLITNTHNLISQNKEVLSKTHKVLEQNRNISDSLTTLLSLHKEHLPTISRNSRLSNEIKRMPPSGGFPFQRRRRPDSFMSP
jgi:predicted ribosome quality control (RQC) complex YloA/Tae2 family protein